MEKSPDAFRTISEVADYLDTPAHVLRFWESRFPQIKPVKRAGGRRYYRPADVALLGGIRHLLHDEGLTIRGVQKILREQGVKHVSTLSGEDADAAFDAILDIAEGMDFPLSPPAPDEPRVVALSDWIEASTEAVYVGPVDLPQTDLSQVEAVLESAALTDTQSVGDADDALTSEAMALPDSELIITDEAAEDFNPDQASALDAMADSANPARKPAPSLQNTVATAQLDLFANLAMPEATSDLGEAASDYVAVDPLEVAAPAAPIAAAAPLATASLPLSADSPVEADDLPEQWLPATLRALRPGALAEKSALIRPLQARLAALQDRLTSAARLGRS